MAAAWRLVLAAAVAAMIGPALAAIAIVAFGRLQGCAPEAGACGSADLGAWLAFALDWAWRRILDLRVLGPLTARAAAGAAFGFTPRARAVLWGFMGACWGAIAALILPYVAVFWSLPPGCRLTEAGADNCVVWGHAMGDAFAMAGAAFWWSIVIVPVSLGGVLLTFLLATAARRWNRPA